MILDDAFSKYFKLFEIFLRFLIEFINYPSLPIILS